MSTNRKTTYKPKVVKTNEPLGVKTVIYLIPAPLVQDIDELDDILTTARKRKGHLIKLNGFEMDYYNYKGKTRKEDVFETIVTRRGEKKVKVGERTVELTDYGMYVEHKDQLTEWAINQLQHLQHTHNTLQKQQPKKSVKLELVTHLKYLPQTEEELEELRELFKSLQDGDELYIHCHANNEVVGVGPFSLDSKKMVHVLTHLNLDVEKHIVINIWGCNTAYSEEGSFTSEFGEEIRKQFKDNTINIGITGTTGRIRTDKFNVQIYDANDCEIEADKSSRVFATPKREELLKEVLDENEDENISPLSLRSIFAGIQFKRGRQKAEEIILSKLAALNLSDDESKEEEQVETKTKKTSKREEEPTSKKKPLNTATRGVFHDNKAISKKGRKKKGNESEDDSYEGSDDEWVPKPKGRSKR